MNRKKIIIAVLLLLTCFSLPIVWSLLAQKTVSTTVKFLRQNRELSLAYLHHVDLDFEPFEIEVFGGAIYLLDIRGSSIVVLDSTGKFIRRIGKRGQGPGEFQHIVGWSVSNQGLEIIDSGNLTISKINPDGSFIKSQKINRALMQGDCFTDGRYVICSQLNRKERELEIFNAMDSSFLKITGTILDGKDGMAYSGFVNTNNEGLGILSGYFHGFITCFDDSGKVLYNKLTIDRTPPPEIIHEGGDGEMISFPDPEAPITIYSTLISSNKLFLVSRIKSANDQKNSTPIDVYKLDTGDYLYSFYIPNFSGNNATTFTFVPTQKKLIAYQGESLVFYALEEKS